MKNRMSNRLFFYVMFLNAVFLNNALYGKIKLYTLVSPSHEFFLNDWFLPTIKDDYEIVIRRIQQQGTGVFMQEGWIDTMIAKCDLIINAINECWGSYFVYSDVDAEFFGRTHTIIKKAIKKKDIVFQLDSPYGNPCAGFFACRANEKTLKLWTAVKQKIIDNYGLQVCDQQALEIVLN